MATIREQCEQLINDAVVTSNATMEVLTSPEGRVEMTPELLTDQFIRMIGGIHRAIFLLADRLDALTNG